jgi:hypothetical protein
MSPIDTHEFEHQPESFCTWLACGGVKPGYTHGESDEFGFRPVAGRIHLHDLHASMLHLLAWTTSASPTATPGATTG